MADELIDICDENNNLLGIRKMKSEAHQVGLWHRAAHVWVYNSKGEVLLQLRAKNKDLFPNMWDVSAAGHVGAGEKPISAAMREINEEIGISVKETDLYFFKVFKYQGIFRGIIDNCLIHIYLYQLDESISNLKLQKEEVETIKLIPIKEIETGLKMHSEKYTPNTDHYWDEAIGEIKHKLNII